MENFEGDRKRLWEVGPLIPVRLAPQPHRAEEIRNAGGEPRENRVEAFIDTGSDSNFIPNQLAFVLALDRLPEDARTLDAEKGETNCPRYRLRVAFESLRFDIVAVGTGHQCVLGREFLSFCTMIYDGITGCVRIEADSTR